MSIHRLQMDWYPYIKWYPYIYIRSYPYPPGAGSATSSAARFLCWWFISTKELFFKLWTTIKKLNEPPAWFESPPPPLISIPELISGYPGYLILTLPALTSCGFCSAGRTNFFKSFYRVNLKLVCGNPISTDINIGNPGYGTGIPNIPVRLNLYDRIIKRSLYFIGNI